MNVLFCCLSAQERNDLSSGMNYACVCGLISFNELPYKTDKVLCDQCVLMSGRLAGASISHIVLWSCSYKTRHIQMKAPVPLGVLTDLNERVRSSERLRLLPNLLPSSPFPFAVLPPHRKLCPPTANLSSIRHRPAYLTDLDSLPLHA